MFKPFYCGVPSSHESLHVQPGSKSDESHWWQWEKWHRLALHNYTNARDIWSSTALPEEASWMSGAHLQKNGTPGHAAFAEHANNAMRKSMDVLKLMVSKIHQDHHRLPGFLYRFAWQGWNRKARLFK
jgi:dipeptidase